MPIWIRVRDTSGHKVDVRADVPEGHPRGVLPGMEVLEEPRAEWKPPKYRLPLGEPLPGGKVARKRAKANAGTPHEPVPVVEPTPEANDGHQADTEGED